VRVGANRTDDIRSHGTTRVGLNNGRVLMRGAASPLRVGDNLRGGALYGPAGSTNRMIRVDGVADGVVADHVHPEIIGSGRRTVATDPGRRTVATDVRHPSPGLFTRTPVRLVPRGGLFQAMFPVDDAVPGGRRIRVRIHRAIVNSVRVPQ
jgi:hypothetical protein